MVLDHTAIADRSLAAFAGHDLRVVSLCDTDVRPETAERFQAEHPELKSFDHWRSPSEAHRGAIQQLIGKGAIVSEPPDAVEENVVLHVMWHGMPEDLVHLADVETDLRVVLADPFCTEEYVRRLAELDAAEEVVLEIKKPAVDLLGQLAGMERLKCLHLALWFGEDGLLTAVKADDVDGLAHVPNLERITLACYGRTGAPNVLPDALLTLARCPKLKHLDLRRVDLSEETLAKIVACPNLEEITLKRIPNLAPEVIESYQERLRGRAGGR